MSVRDRDRAAHRALKRCLVVVPLLSVAGGCTVFKPLVGAVTAPLYAMGLPRPGAQSMWGQQQPSWSGRGAEGQGAAIGLVGLFGFFSACGVVGGLVTGFVSDVNWATGRCTDPTRNWSDPFRTNVD